MVPNYSCGDYGKVVAFIADRSIVTTLPIAQFLSSYGYSQISYGATDPVLNDRTLYPYHFSTGVNDDVQHIAIAELMERLGWTWVIILAPGDDHGESESKNLMNEINKHGACVDFIGTLTEDTNTNIRTLERIQKSTAEVVVLCGGLFRTEPLISLVETMIKDKTLVIPQTWLHLYSNMLFNGSLIFFNENNLCYNRSKSKLDELALNESILYTDVYFYMERCLTLDKEKDDLFQKAYGTDFNNCSSLEISVLPQDPNYQVYRAATGLAHAEHLMLSSSGKSHHKDIHKYIHRKQILKSQCSPNCPPGYRKVPRERAPPCCYDCARCSEGEISNLTDMEYCLKCHIYEWPNNEKTMCIEKQTEFLSYEADSLTLVFLVLSVVSISLVTVILGIFISFRDTPLVKANNRNLSFILLFSIKLSFLSVFLFLGRPSDITCILRQTSFGISFSIAMSSVLAKTIMVCIAFKASKPDSPWRKWLRVKITYFIVIICSFIQFLISAIWLTISPPFMELNILSEPGKIIIQCNEGSVIAFYIVLSYMGLLASVSFIVAFLARTLPDSFNEAKYIT
ncbi:vomeronasal type-2 receptor 26, partial [Xenopus laevis]|uniref:Vomeronasal type-2 receptor 26 n=1 Tax=Xenopus laevis TaxID=8355 RepID=A0A8J0TXK6_XENLA